MPFRLVGIDTSGIQSYIFGSNRLREQVGASYLVAQATTTWVREALPQPNNLRASSATTLELAENAWIERDSLAAEVIYAGGGNLIALCRDEATARRFVSDLTRRALAAAPGLALAAAHRECDFANTALTEALRDLHDDLDQIKRAQPPANPLLGLGVSATCRSTGLPAVGRAGPFGEEELTLVSAETLAKLAARDDAERRVRAAFPLDGADLAWTIPLDLDHLGRTSGEESHIAIVHADGNGMGKRLQAIADRYPGPDDNRAYVRAVRDFSRELTRAAAAAQSDLLRDLIEWIKSRLPGHPWCYQKLRPAEVGRYLPLRPLIFGGDDLTFVCDGRLGLALATRYLKHFQRQTASLPGGSATAAAGIAIVRSHFPIARAYQLGVDLCAGAKQYGRSLNSGVDQPPSTLDWHLAPSGLIDTLEAIRQREYTVRYGSASRGGSLTLRPVTLNANPLESTRSWAVVEKGIAALSGPDWSTRRNKVKALREALREGPTAVEAFLSRFNEGRPLPVVAPTETNLPRTGWAGRYCAYFDAIEAADWYQPIEEELAEPEVER